MSEKSRVPKRFRPSISRENIDTGFVAYLSKCINDQVHHWGTATAFDEVKEQGVVVGHVSILECPVCFKKARVPLSV